MLSVLSGGPALWRERELLFINSHGFAQETFHTFDSPGPATTARSAASWPSSPRPTEAGAGRAAAGDAAARWPTDTRVARTVDDACVAAARVLGRHPPMLPFASIYLLDGERRHAVAYAAGRVARRARRPAAPPFAGVPRDAARRDRRSPAAAWRLRGPPRGRSSSRPQGARRPLAARRERALRLQSSSASPRGAPTPSDTGFPRAGRRADRAGDHAAPWRSKQRSAAAPKRWPSSIAPRPRSSATSATSSARR